MIPQTFNIPDRDAAARFFEACDIICDACTDEVHCNNCAMMTIRSSADCPEPNDD